MTMDTSSFYEAGSKLLTPGAFEFVLDSELRRAVRAQNFLTLVVLETAREWDGVLVTADEGTVQEVADIIGREVRDTDLLGHTDKGSLAIALLDADALKREAMARPIVNWRGGSRSAADQN